MTITSGPIFENSVFADAASLEELAPWLETYVSELHSDAGLVDARLLRSSGGADPAFVVQLSFESNEALDEFLAGRVSSLESNIDDASGGMVRQVGRVLREDSSQSFTDQTACLNCGTLLRGQYCAQCGQRSQSRLISLWGLISDAFGDLFELDSRLWQTLVPLLVRPGRLTADYLQGKRARFMPPFRTYLVLSLLFFVVAFFDPREELAILFADSAVDTPGEIAADASEESSDALDGAESEAAVGDNPEFNISVNDRVIDDSSNCQLEDADLEDIPVWVQRRLTPERFRHICKQALSDDGKQLTDNLVDNIPAALIFLLPLMALALKVLYPLSRRYYVEHLLFFVHFHAFFFLILSLQLIWSRLIGAIGLHDAIAIVPMVVSSLYIPIYLFKAMRRVYGQGFILTFLKYAVLVAVYVVGFGIMLFAALAIAAFSI